MRLKETMLGRIEISRKISYSVLCNEAVNVSSDWILFIFYRKIKKKKNVSVVFKKKILTVSLHSEKQTANPLQIGQQA